MTRKNLAAMAMAILAFCGVTKIVDAARPNVLLIYSDDQGTLDANCYGSHDLVTPTLDHLAETGIRFTRMYAPSCICSSSRAGLLTGRFPARAGVPSNAGRHGLPTSEITIPEVLQAAGYRTGLVGKWHLGSAPGERPNDQGFESSFGHLGGCIDNYSHFFFWDGPNRHDLYRDGVEVYHDGEYFLDLMVEECTSFLKQNRAEPFFLYWAFNAPHYPYQGTAPWRQRYADLDMPRREYAAFVSTLDEHVGQVLDELTALGLRDNTIVIFQSDHGHSTEVRAFGGGGNAGDLRGAKGSLFEGGLRVPSFISWPTGLPQGEVRDQLVSGCDWLPTLCELCEVPLPQSNLDGRDLSKVLRQNAATPHSEFYWQFGTGNNAQLALRQGPWKLLVNPVDTSHKQPLTEDDRLYLVNLEEDPSELHNLMQTSPQKGKELHARLSEIQQQLASPKP